MFVFCGKALHLAACKKKKKKRIHPFQKAPCDKRAHLSLKAANSLSLGRPRCPLESVDDVKVML